SRPSALAADPAPASSNAMITASDPISLRVARAISPPLPYCHYSGRRPRPGRRAGQAGKGCGLRDPRVQRGHEAVRILEIKPCIHRPEGHRFVVAPNVEVAGKAFRGRPIGWHAGKGDKVFQRHQAELSLAGQEGIKEYRRVRRIKIAAHASGIKVVKSLAGHIRTPWDEAVG